MGGVDGYSCSAKAPKECADFLNFIATTEQQTAYYKAFNSPPVNTEAQKAVTEPYLKDVLAAYNKAPYVSQWLDTILGQNVGNALNVAVVDMLAGKSDAQGTHPGRQRRSAEGLRGTSSEQHPRENLDRRSRRRRISRSEAGAARHASLPPTAAASTPRLRLGGAHGDRHPGRAGGHRLRRLRDLPGRHGRLLRLLPLERLRPADRLRRSEELHHHPHGPRLPGGAGPQRLHRGHVAGPPGAGRDPPRAAAQPQDARTVAHPRADLRAVRDLRGRRRNRLEPHALDQRRPQRLARERSASARGPTTGSPIRASRSGR